MMNTNHRMADINMGKVGKMTRFVEFLATIVIFDNDHAAVLPLLFIQSCS